jgi:hypothetical protein
MKIRIVKASDPHYWYVHHIGEVFDVHIKNNGTREYDVITNDIYGSGCVHFSDAEEVIEHNSQLYRKVDRPVREGDTVLITKATDTFGKYNNGDIIEVERKNNTGIFSSTVATKDDLNDDGYVSNKEYVVLELIEQTPQAPSYSEVSELLHEAKEDKKKADDDALLTFLKSLPNDETNESKDIVEYNGKKYRKVKRKANVSELVVVVEDFAYGKIGEVHTVLKDDVEYDALVTDKSRLMNHSRYNVLELVEQSSQSELDLIANLAQEVVELKRDNQSLRKTVDQITKYDLGWERFGPGRISELETKVSRLKHSVVTLEDKFEQSEHETDQYIDELAGRINDLGDGAVDLDELITELEALRTKENDFSRSLYDHGDRVNGQYRDGVASGIHIAITRIKEALRNG